MIHSNTDLDKILKVFWERAMLAATQSFAGDPYTITSRSAKAKLEAHITARIITELQKAYKELSTDDPEYNRKYFKDRIKVLKANPEQEER